MYTKVIHLIFIALVLALAPTSFGTVLGDWENDEMDEWSLDNTANVSLSFSTTGATLHEHSLRMEASGGWQNSIFCSVGEDIFNAFMSSHEITVDITRLASEWAVGPADGYCQLFLCVNVGAGSDWLFWDTLDQTADWSSDQGDQTMTVTYDYSMSIPKIQSEIDAGNIPWVQLFFCTNYDPAYTTGGIYYLDNVRIVGSRTAFKPSPADGASDVQREPTLRWTPGVYASTHDVYFGTDFNDVNDVNTANLSSYPDVTLTSVDVNSFEPDTLEFNTTYYWRVDEVNDIHPDRMWEGSVWSFTTGNYLVVDDFEDYNDYSPDRIFDAWVDGWSVAANGSQVGWDAPPFAEQTIVHSGSQSMPFFYNNTSGATYSEATRTFDTPQDWTQEDVQTLTLFFKGYPLAFVEEPPGKYTISASGTDIWDISDEFRYAYKMLSGDGSISACVVSIDNTDLWAKAGVMIRETLEPFSVHGLMCVTPENRRAFQNRTVIASDSYSSNSDAEAIALPLWVRLVRQGNLITGYYSEDGINWIQQPDDESTGDGTSPNPQTIVMQQNIYIGLALCSHNANAVCTAVFSDVTTTGNVTDDDWQVEAIGVEMPTNDPAPLYIAVQNGGTEKVIEHPDNPNVVLANDWQQWDILLSVFSDAGVDLTSVKKLSIGVGDQAAPLNGTGMLYIDDVWLYSPLQTEPDPNATTEE